ncbi:MAG: AMP-binding protein, partial [bacterium]|nr:AMP-binding protein [bacterium]
MYELKDRIKKLTPDQLLKFQESLNKRGLKIAHDNIILKQNYNVLKPVSEQKEYYSLSSSQRRLWILDQFDEDGIAYNMPAAFILEGMFEVDVFKQAYSFMIGRHEGLRTVFITENGEPKQKILKTPDFNIEIIDLRENPNVEKEAKILAERDLQTSFNLEVGPLVRFTIVRLEDEKFLLLFNMHHIISDGWSMNIFVKEFLTSYESFNEGKTPELTPLKIHYKDYSAWQNNLLNSAEIGSQREYWLDKLSGKIPVLDLPADKIRPVTQTFNGNNFCFVLPEEINSGLNDLYLENKASLFMMLQTLLKILFYRYTGQEDIILGSPVAGRVHKDLENQIGFYVNTLCLRDTIEGDLTFNEFLERVKKTCTDAFDNQEYPFDKLVEELDEKRDLSRSPIFDVMLVLQNNEATVIEFEGLNLSSYKTDNITSKFDMTFNFSENDGGLFCGIEYNTDIYSEDRIERMAEHLKLLISSVLENPESRIKDLNIIPSNEKNLLLNVFNDTKTEYPQDKTIVDLFEEQVKKTPDNIAVVFDDVELTYREVNEKANATGHFLLNTFNIKSEDFVGILMERSEHMMILILALWKIGSVYIPLSPSNPEKRIKDSIIESKIKLLITDKKTSKKLDFLYQVINSSPSLDSLFYIDEIKNLDEHNEILNTYKISSLLQDRKNISFNRSTTLRFMNEIKHYEEYKNLITRLSSSLDKLSIESTIGIVIDNPINMVIALSSLNNQRKFINISSELPEDNKKKILLENQIKIILTEANLQSKIDSFLWEEDVLESYIILDEYDFRSNKKERDFKQVWDFIAENTTFAINDYGWMNSYTNEPFSEEEMVQYINNFKLKLNPYLTSESRVLEIGCGHGLVLSEISGKVGYYLATDLTDKIIKRNKELIVKNNIKNVELRQLAASELDELDIKDFDIIICSSIIHYFPDTVYLENVIKNMVDKIKDTGIIYLDDLMDQSKKHLFAQSLLEYKQNDTSSRTKSDFNNDLFIHKSYFDYIQKKYPEVVDWESSEKLGEIKNELTEYRYDVLLRIDKKHTMKSIISKRYFLSDFVDIKSDSSLDIFQDKKNQLCTVFDITALDVSRKNNLMREIRPTDLSYIIFTSGSTGVPKGAMVEHAGMLNHLLSKIDILGITEKNRIVQNASHCFDISIWQFFAALLKGGTTYIYNNDLILNPSKMIQQLMEDNITIFEVVPTFLSLLLESIDRNIRLVDLEFCLVTGEEVKKDVVEQWFDLFPGKTLVNAYGPTEASDDITHYVMDRAPEHSIVPIGKPVQNFNIYIIDKNFKLCPIGVDGELVVSGMGVGRGYVNNPERTALVFMDDPFIENETLRLYKTGDLARWRPDGNIEFLGRIDHQVKIRGFRIELGEIENSLIKHNEISSAVVVAKEGTDGDDQLVAYYVSDEELDTSELRFYLRRSLPDYMVPSFFMHMGTLPLTSNGKIDRKALPEVDGSLSSVVEYVAPCNEIQEKLVRIWQDVLGIKRNPGIDDNFFELGGDSIKAIQIMSRLRLKNLKGEIASLFSSPTIKEFALTVKEETRTIDQSPVTGIVPLTPIQKWFFTDFRCPKHHFNQSVMLKIKEPIDEVKLGALKMSASKLITHHDALRMNYQQKDRSVVQENRPEIELYFKEYDLGNEADATSRIEEIASTVQSSINLEDDILIRFVFFNIKGGSRLLIVAHHLVIDGVSWRILIADLESGYRQAVENKGIKLPFKTTSFKSWSENLAQYAVSPKFEKEVLFWKELDNKRKNILPCLDSDKRRERISSTISLNKEDTDLLLLKTNQAFNTGINDILLTALVRALSKWTGEREITLELESHGRSEQFDGIDLSRTIGWFTSVYPVVLETAESGDIGEDIIGTKESLREIPDNGTGYGVYKYISPEGLSGAGRSSEILFNYMGQFDTDIDTGLFGIAAEPIGKSVSPEVQSSHKLNFNGIVTVGIFSMTLDSDVYTRVELEEIQAIYKEELINVSSYCNGSCKSIKTSSDFTLPELRQKEYFELLNRNEINDYDVQDIYNLTPMQEGFLFHSMMDKKSSAYFQQTSFDIKGKLDVELFENAWQYLAGKYDVLRTLFISDFRIPVQIVLKKRNIGFIYQDRRGKEFNEKYLTEIKREDRERKFDFI